MQTTVPTTTAAPPAVPAPASYHSDSNSNYDSAYASASASLLYPHIFAGLDWLCLCRGRNETKQIRDQKLKNKTNGNQEQKVKRTTEKPKQLMNTLHYFMRKRRPCGLERCRGVCQRYFKLVRVSSLYALGIYPFFENLAGY